MTEYTFQTEIKANVKDIWEMYTNFTKRRQWETDLEYIKLDGSFATGTSGFMKLEGQPEMPYTITSAVLYEKYWDRTEILGTGIAICFGHDFTSYKNCTLVKITARLEKSTDEITEKDIQFLSQIFSDTPQSILTIKKLLEN